MLPATRRYARRAMNTTSATFQSQDIEAQQLRARDRFFQEQRARQAKTRKAGAMMAVVGLFLNLLNASVVLTQGRYFVLTVLVGPAMMLLGLWLSIFGQPVDVRTGRMARWGTAGILGAIALGGLASIAAIVLLSQD